MMFYYICRPTSEFPHPLSHVKQPIGYRVSSTVSVNLKLVYLLRGMLVTLSNTVSMFD